MTHRTYTLQELIPYLVRKGKLHYEIEHFGSSMDNPQHVEIAVYQVTLQGNLIATEADRFDYEHIGPPEPFPDPVEVIRDLTDFSVYQYRQRTRDGFREGVMNFVTWIQETCGERLLRVQNTSRKAAPPTLGDMLEEWDRQHTLIDRMEAALGRDVFKMIMGAER